MTANAGVPARRTLSLIEHRQSGCRGAGEQLGADLPVHPERGNEQTDRPRPCQLMLSFTAAEAVNRESAVRGGPSRCDFEQGGLADPGGPLDHDRAARNRRAPPRRSSRPCSSRSRSSSGPASMGS